MRLWHYKLIPYLPRTQLLAQWRELNSIFKKQDNHILINYIYNYDKKYLWDYSLQVLSEMTCRGYKSKENSLNNMKNYFKDKDDTYFYPVLRKYEEHNDEYLTICYYNLKEKYIRGQKDFTQEQWIALDTFYKGEINNE